MRKLLLLAPLVAASACSRPETPSSAARTVAPTPAVRAALVLKGDLASARRDEALTRQLRGQPPVRHRLIAPNAVLRGQDRGIIIPGVDDLGGGK